MQDIQWSYKVHAKVESGSDDPENLGHLFGTSNGSHLQTKLSGCS